MTMHAAPARAGTVSRALARDKLGILASLLQSGSALAVIVLFAAARWPAMNGLFFGGGAMGGLGVMILLAVTSVAVIRYFDFRPGGESL